MRHSIEHIDERLILKHQNKPVFTQGETYLLSFTPVRIELSSSEEIIDVLPGVSSASVTVRVSREVLAGLCSSTMPGLALWAAGWWTAATWPSLKVSGLHNYRLSRKARSRSPGR